MNLLLGCVLLCIASYFWQRHRLQKMASTIFAQAEAEAALNKKRLSLEWEEEKLLKQRAFETACLEEKKMLHKLESSLQAQQEALQKQLKEWQKKEEKWAAQQERYQIECQELEKNQQALLAKIETTAQMSCEEAKEALQAHAHQQMTHELDLLFQKNLDEHKDRCDQEAKRLLTVVMERLAASTVAETTACTVSLPSEELKGRVVGKEGRNIRALEQATGATFLVDETPGAITISCFDPVRRYMAKTVLAQLFSDGRIHPTRIEECVEQTEAAVEKQIYEWGEKAAHKVHVFGLHRDLLYLLGKLRFRTSLGQNVLDHSIEVAQLMHLLAQELGLDASIATRIGLLHDIGKAAPAEQGLSHALAGGQLIRRLGESEAVANGVECHHGEKAAISLEASLCAIADTLSASRLGARIEAVADYLKRLHQLESIVTSYPGVQKAYALQAGREIRVFVSPEKITESQMLPLARSLTALIEQQVAYSGKIKVSLFREARVTDYALSTGKTRS